MARQFHRTESVILLGTNADGNYLVADSNAPAAGDGKFNGVYTIDKGTFESQFVETVNTPDPVQGV